MTGLLTENKANLPLVSIILCTFNGENFLQPQLDTLAQQSYKHIEFICSDNDSTDSTLQILREWCTKDKNRFLFTCNEKGLNKNFFSAISKAKGEYIIFCDQDDIWHTNKVDELITFHLKNDQASLIYCLSKPFQDIKPENFNYKYHQLPLEGKDVKRTLLSCFVLGHNICISSKIIKQIPIPENENVAFDWWIVVSAMCLGEIKCLPKALTLWRKHSFNTTIDLGKGLVYKNRLKALQQFLTNTLIKEQDKKWIEEAIRKYKDLETKTISIPLFLFLMKNASTIFFYKKKKNIILKWISYTKWCIRLSNKNYSVG
jgi:glycosyltransferase involved in cell wall biosynthesis